MYFFGGDRAAADVKVWQAKAGFEAGRCAEVLIQEANQPARRAERLQEAEKYYGYVVEKHPDSDVAKQAKKRLEALAKLRG
jgi:hypothetical protein